MRYTIGLDIGSNSVGSAMIDRQTGEIKVGLSVFPAGVDESDDKRGDPKNTKRRMTRRTRITLARRSSRKRELVRRLIKAGLLPVDPGEYQRLLDSTDPWSLRCRGLDEPLSPFEFGRVLLHLAQRRGALGLKIADLDDEDADDDVQEDGKVRDSIKAVRARMMEKEARTFGEFMAMLRDERTHPIVSESRRTMKAGSRVYRDAIRNKGGSYERCADRAMIRCEFAQLWERQRHFGSDLAALLTDELRLALDDEQGDSLWRHRGLLFGQRRASWDLGTLGRCALHPSDRCAPHADMDASRFRVVETVNNLRIIEQNSSARALSPEERRKVSDYLSGPLGMLKPSKKHPEPRPKTNVTVSDLRKLMGWKQRAGKSPEFRFNIEADAEKVINTDWFRREIVHGAVTLEHWAQLTERQQEGINRAILKLDPDEDTHAERLKKGVMDWAGLDEFQADALVAAWERRPRLDSKRLNMSRRAVRNLLSLMDRDEPWLGDDGDVGHRWLTPIEARKLIAEDAEFRDVTTGEALDDSTRRRYMTGTKGATARDRHYLRKHVLRKDGKVVSGPKGKPLSEPPPAPMISNPVVRKAIHEVRRHVVEHMLASGRRPDEVHIELAREAKMGKKDADRVLSRIRLRNRIRRDIIDSFDLGARTSTQQRSAVDRVVLWAQQGGVCPLCGKEGMTSRAAAVGNGCEVAHIIPRASGGHNGLSNIVLSHTKCNRDMARRTPRQFWSAGSGFEQGMVWVEGIYDDVKRPSPAQAKSATGEALWACYFSPRDDKAKVERFKLDIKDIQQEMQLRQLADTRYASRQVMSYLADALYDGKGLPERSAGNDERRIFATDGLWTSRLCREWGLFFDPHKRHAHGLSNDEEHERREKDRGDHRHHAIDAVAIAYCTRQVQIAWEEREKQADKDGVNTASEEAMEVYRRANRLPPPEPFKSREEFRQAVRLAVYGDDATVRPVCHKPVKRRLVGALHEETLLGPILNRDGRLTDAFTARKSVLELTPKHLRPPREETETEAIGRLAARRVRDRGVDAKAAKKWARGIVSSTGFVPKIVDPPPGKSGIVRDRTLRERLRQCLTESGMDPDSFTKTEVKKLVEDGKFRQASGVPIRSMVLKRTMTDPVVVSRWATDHATGQKYRAYDAATNEGDARTARAYLGGNNHHIEIRVDAQGKWSGDVVTAFEASQRNLARLRALREAGVPSLKHLRKMPREKRCQWRSVVAKIEQEHSIVDRSEDQAKGGAFVMSCCEGETLYMKDKRTGELGYFVVAKLDKPQSIVVVPHWDARPATKRKGMDGAAIASSDRNQFTVTPTGLKDLAPPGHEHTVKVRVSPLGDIQILEND
ncbi:MAG: HNH endonuclease [Phycisphaeraceae bacterium]|nr:HNH endonuclease [Phycisphaeraceae bacterium]